MSKIFVHRRTNPFAQIDRSLAQDKRLSFGARGLALYILSLPVDWKINLEDLANRSPAGKDAVRTMVRELMKFGYLTRERARSKGGLLKGYDYTLHEVPTIVGLSNVGSSNVGSTNVGSSNTTIEDSIEEKQSSIETSNTVKQELDVVPIVEDCVDDKASQERLPAPKAPEREKKLTKAQILDQNAQRVLDYWNKNLRADKEPLYAKEYLKHIRKRIEEGATGKDCVAAIKDRVLAWVHDPNMMKNLNNPVTTFRAANFPKYVDGWKDRTPLDQKRADDIPAFIASPPKPKTKPNSPTGTAHYTAPEIAESGPYAR